MIAIIETATGIVERIVIDTDGLDMEGRTAADVPSDYDPVAVSHVWSNGEWQPNVAAALARKRAERDALLAESDWTQLPDVPAEISAAWREYRQNLRDIMQAPDPLSAAWPTPPESQ